MIAALSFVKKKSMHVETAPVKEPMPFCVTLCRDIRVYQFLRGKIFPSGKRISDYSDDDIFAVELWANSLSRKVLGYKTPDEALGAEIDKIDAA